MKKPTSLWYRLTGTPSTPHDFEEWIGSERPATVHIKLKTSEMMREWYLITQLLAEFTLSNHKTSRTIERTLGGYLQTESIEAREKKVKKANSKIRDAVETMREAGATVIEHQTCFPSISEETSKGITYYEPLSAIRKQ